jgi:hypothetical protein
LIDWKDTEQKQTDKKNMNQQRLLDGRSRLRSLPLARLLLLRRVLRMCIRRLVMLRRRILAVASGRIRCRRRLVVIILLRRMLVVLLLLLMMVLLLLLMMMQLRSHGLGAAAIYKKNKIHIQPTNQ